MSSNEYFYRSPDLKVSAFQKLSLDDENQNPVSVLIENPNELEITTSGNHTRVAIEICQLEMFDQLAIEWCKKRGLIPTS